MLTNEQLAKIREACKELGRGLSDKEYCEVLGVDHDPARSNEKQRRAEAEVLTGPFI